MLHKLVLILSLLISSSTYGQQIRSQSTQDILLKFEEKGIDSIFRTFNTRDMPIYRIDTALALKIAYACDSPDQYNLKLNFLCEVSFHLKDQKLTENLLQYLRTNHRIYKDKKRIFIIEENIFFCLAYQNNSISIEPLKEEFKFWKLLGDSLATNISDTTNKLSSLYQSFSSCRYNYRGIAWTLYKLGQPEFTAEYVQSLNITSPIEKMRPLNLNADNAKWDTLTLSKNYSSIKEVNFINDAGVEILYKFFGKLDKTCEQDFIFNSNSGLLYSSCWRSERDSWFTVFEVKLIAANKLLYRWVRGAVS